DGHVTGVQTCALPICRTHADRALSHVEDSRYRRCLERRTLAARSGYSDSAGVSRYGPYARGGPGRTGDFRARAGRLEQRAARVAEGTKLMFATLRRIGSRHFSPISRTRIGTLLRLFGGPASARCGATHSGDRALRPIRGVYATQRGTAVCPALFVGRIDLPPDVRPDID